MAETPCDASPDASKSASPDVDTLIAALHTAGADKFDLVGLRYIESLAKRAAAHQGSIKRMLETKLAHALVGLKERFERAQSEAGEALEQGRALYPHASGELEKLFAAGDFKGLRRRIATLKAHEQNTSLRALVQQLERAAPENGDARVKENAGPRPELRTLRQFRDTWSKLSVDKQVAHALEQAPKNAGPINSHMLVLRSLVMMRDISPDYLNRFISYADTLLALDPGEKEKPVIAKKTAAKTAKK